MTQAEKRLLELARKIENQKSKEDLVIRAVTMVQAQEALKQDYRLKYTEVKYEQGRAGNY